MSWAKKIGKQPDVVRPSVKTRGTQMCALQSANRKALDNLSETLKEFWPRHRLGAVVVGWGWELLASKRDWRHVMLIQNALLSHGC